MPDEEELYFAVSRLDDDKLQEVLDLLIQFVVREHEERFREVEGRILELEAGGGGVE